MFCRLLAGEEEKGFCDVVLHGCKSTQTQYVRNTAIVQTTMEDGAGNALRITDFAPRFMRFERVFHPAQIFRRIEPLNGVPRITIRVRPTFNYGGPCAGRSVGSNHIRYTGGIDALRLTTDAPLSYITGESAFALTQPMTLILGSDEPFESAIDTLVARIPGAHARLLDYLGARPRPSGWNGKASSYGRRSRSSSATSTRPAPSSPPIPPPSRRHPAPTARGTIATAGCVTPTSSSRR